MAKIFKIHGYFVDPNGEYTAEELATALQQDFDVIAHHIKVDERDIGEWDDNSPLNYHNCSKDECEAYFRSVNQNERQ